MTDKWVNIPVSHLVKLHNFMHTLEFALDQGEAIQPSTEHHQGIETFVSNIGVFLLDNGYSPETGEQIEV